MHDDPRQRLFEPLATDFEQEPQLAFETVTGKTRHRLRHRASTFLIEIFEADMNDARERSRFARQIDAWTREHGTTAALAECDSFPR